jgi:DNA polymerase-3 subunit gamma/tau
MPVLYRTYRPAKWSEVMGQDHIVEALKDAIANERVSHAYLFSGSRGTGKTTVSRIMAHELKTADEDINEIDAASNRGIDDIRALREHVSVLPFSSTYKVYIIDEVHMLSKDAWNALLKTLEEPPKHVIFILATTELEKVPETIISRCQTFAFRKPPRDIIGKEAIRIAKEEGYTLDAGAADLIALLGDGSFRDALGMLEKVISAAPSGQAGKSSDKKISRDIVESITGAPRAELVNRFIEAFISKNADAALAVLGEAEKIGISMNTFVTLVLEKCRFILLVQHSSASKTMVKERVSPDDWAFIETQAAKKLLTPAMLIALLDAADGVGRARIEALPLELAVVEVCA